MSLLDQYDYDLYHDYQYVSELRAGCFEFSLLQVTKKENIQKVWLRILPDNEQRFVEMSYRDGLWRAQCDVHQSLLSYRFAVLIDGRLFWLNRFGISESNPLDMYDFKLLPHYHAPEWLGSAVFYQIFPDSFANPGGHTKKNVQAAIEAYGRGPHYVQPGEAIPHDIEAWFIFQGGGFADIQAAIPTMKELGVNAVYLNPVFTAFTTYKYDSVNYEIDIDLGGEDGLRALINNLHSWGIKIILDVVPNHCGVLHEWFQKALADPDSPEYKFFNFTDASHKDYYCWLGVKSLPKFDYSSMELRNRMYRNPDSLLKRFLFSEDYAVSGYGIDGWRVDVGNMIGFMGSQNIHSEVCREMSTAVKSVNPDAYFMGEHYFDASGDLQGDIFDGVMNYSGFRFPLIAWLSHNSESMFGDDFVIQAEKALSTRAFIETMCSRLFAIPECIGLQQYNLLSSHDTPRIASLLSRQDMVLAVSLQFTWPGIPAIYYGDEFATEDHPHLGSRNLPDRNGDAYMYELHQTLIALRKNNPCLQSGGLRILAIQEHAFAFVRTDKQTASYMIVAINRSKNAEVLQLSNDVYGFDTMEVAAKSCRILVKSRENESEYSFTYAKKM